jgi:hypothetical protein
MKPQQTAVSVVLLGNFAPAEFELEPMRQCRALGPEELLYAAYEALLPNQVVVVTLPWGKLTVLQDRVTAEVTTVPYIRCADLVLKLLHEASPNSLVTKFGINMTSHYRFADLAARDKFAMRLAPPSAWGKFGAIVEKSFQEREDRHGGVMKLTMRQAKPSDRSAGWIDATIEPSALFHKDQGVAIMINDHYDTSAEDLAAMRQSARATSEELLSLFERNFEKSVERSFGICDDVFGGES